MSSSLLEPPLEDSSTSNLIRQGSNNGSADGSERGRSPNMHAPHLDHLRSSSRTPTSAEIDAVIAAAMANAPPPIPMQPEFTESLNRSVTPLMTNLLPSAVGIDGRVNLFVGNLPYRVRWQDLKDLFRKAGTVLRADVSLGPDNRSRGYGTVLMGSREDAARAIDRYNGYTWQTRTLEVRPDRLPPEYEPQNHQPPHPYPHAHPHPHSHSQGIPQRPGVFQYHSSGHPPFPMSGHLTPQNSWQGRPSFPNGPGHSVSHGLLVPGAGIGSNSIPMAPPMGLSGSSPIPSSHSPTTLYPSVSLPLSVQNTGQGQLYPQLAASPLAGSLSSGIPQPQPQSHSHTSLSQSTSPDPTYTIPQPRSTSPNPNAIGNISIPTSNHDQHSTSVSPSRGDNSSGRAPPPGNLGQLPPPPFSGVKAVISPTQSNQPLAPSGPSSVGVDSSISSPPGIPRVPIAPIPQLEGLAHQGMGLGPPETLHDRVIFVSNLPLSIQWQDLKDLLRPAGTIIRADVATDNNGRPRGFGTALFASEGDAAKAVNMFNDREVQGQRIKAHLERDSQVELPPNGSTSRRGSAADSAQTPPMNGTSNPSDKPAGSAVDTLTPAETPADAQPSVESSPIAKLPWSLNTSLQHQTPGRPGPSQGHGPTHQTPGLHQHTPNFRQLHHPGPISMPPFPPMQDNPLSPLQSRGLPPMTPSMPGFVFNAPIYPETPPIHHHGFMSSSSNSHFGPFSPGIPVTSPNAFGYNPFSAPGAPIRFPQNPNAHSHQFQGSAALGTPTTQSFPILNGNNAGYNVGPPGSISQTLNNQDYFPPTIGGGGGNNSNSNSKFQNNAPDTPTPKLNSNRISNQTQNQSNNNNLNAKERLASTESSEDDLPEITNKLNINGNENGRERRRSPDSPSTIRRTISNTGTTMGGGGGLLPSEEKEIKSRISLDERRTLDPPISNNDRRASFDGTKR